MLLSINKPRDKLTLDDFTVTDGKEDVADGDHAYELKGKSSQVYRIGLGFLYDEQAMEDEKGSPLRTKKKLMIKRLPHMEKTEVTMLSFSRVRDSSSVNVNTCVEQ